MSQLYVNDPSAQVSITTGRFTVRYKDGMEKSIPAETLEGISVFGEVNMQSFGFRIQKSAFEARLPEGKYNKMIAKLSPMVSSEGSVRIYKIRGTGAVTVFGKDDTMQNEDVIIIYGSGIPVFFPFLLRTAYLLTSTMFFSGIVSTRR